MIVNLSISNIGENVEFSYRTPLRGLQEITSFTDSTNESAPDKVFTKEFRFTLDGVNYSDWYQLTLLELQNRIHVDGVVPIKNDLIIEFRYTRAGTDNTGLLTINQVVVDGVFTFEYLQTLDFENTVYEDVAWTDEFFNLVWINLLGKLYDKGIVPSFLERGDEVDDEDYIVLFKTLSYYFALTSALVDNKVTHMYDFDDLLTQYLKERSLLICDDDVLQNMQHVANNAYDQIRQRASLNIVREDGNFTDNIIINPKHGELLRFLCYDIIKDEFLFEYSRGGWYVEESSPVFYGLSNHVQLNKTPQNTEDILSTLPYLGSGMSIITDGGKSVLRLLGSGSYVELPVMKVHDGIGYQLSFFVKREAGVGRLNISLAAFDSDNFPTVLENAQTGSIQNIILQNYDTFPVGQYLYVTAVIKASTDSLLTDSTLDIGFGDHLRFKEDTRRLSIYISVGDSDPTTDIRIWDLKFTPHLSYISSVFVNGTDFSNIICVNRNLVNTETTVKNKIREYLMPKGSIQHINILP